MGSPFMIKNEVNSSQELIIIIKLFVKFNKFYTNFALNFVYTFEFLKNFGIKNLVF